MIINFTKTAYTAPDLNRPGAGAEQWHNQNTVNIPTEGTNTQRLDVYWRFTWARIETAKDQYNWSYLINILNSAITKKQKVSFGIMSVYHDPEDGVLNYDGGYSSYPLYLHQLMQAEQVKDWKSPMSGGWVPNYNSQNYLGRLRALNASLNNLLETGSSSGVKYKDIINSIDVRGYGNYGEWHNGGIVDTVSQIPSGAHATAASLKAIIDAHTQTLPNYQLSIIMTAFDANWLQHTQTSPEVGYYALTTKNNYGKLGWRRDNWGATDNYIRDLLVNNTRTWNGVALNTLIMPVYKYAPVTGEPMNTAPNEYGDFENQVRLYHANSFGNGNINQSVTTGVKDHIRAASKAAGYRIAVESAEITVSGKSVTIKMNWINEGRAPSYSNWNIVFDLIKSGVTTELGKSTFKLKLFQPAGVATTAIDTLSKDVSDGVYELRFKVIDPVYGIPMPIFITAQNVNGSYSLGSVTLSGGVIEPPVNKPPVVSAGPDREISFPTKTTTLVGSVSDTDGTIPADGITWSQIEGPIASTIVTPKTATTTVNFTKEGTYKYRITGKDNLGATSVDEVIVQVNPEIVVPPVARKVVGIRIDQALVLYDDQTAENFNPQ